MSFLSDFADDVIDSLADDLADEITYWRGANQYTAIGWISDLDLAKISAVSNVIAGDMMVTILRRPFGPPTTGNRTTTVGGPSTDIIPKAGDAVTVRGVKRAVLSVAGDAAGVSWNLHVRG